MTKANRTVEAESDLDFQARMLQEVSETYATTIPLLPEHLQDVVSNAYLLCRIADSIEDDRDLPLPDKEEYLRQFTEIVAGERPPEAFASKLGATLGPSIPEVERILVLNTERVIRITLSFNVRQRKALERCIRIMSEGMLEFQPWQSTRGLNDLPHLDRYCYFVAGVVGEMLAELFCAHSTEIDKRCAEMHTWSVFYGKGLQMTNIIKDIWEDLREGICWLPRDMFLESGFDLTDLSWEKANPGFVDGLIKLIAVAKQHLHKGLEFALTVPNSETHIRRHIVWTLGLSALALRRVYFSDSFSRGQDIKLSKTSVRITIAVLNSIVRSNIALKAFFYLLTRPLPQIGSVRQAAS